MKFRRIVFDYEEEHFTKKNVHFPTISLQFSFGNELSLLSHATLA